MKKKTILLVIGMCAFFMPAKSQSLDEVIEILVLDIEKLSEMKTTLNDMYKAYTILDKGYSDIKDIVSGNFNLHKAFLDALLAISPTVKNYARVAEIVTAEYNIVKEYQTSFNKMKSGGRFTAGELDYLSKWYGLILQQGTDCITRLTMVITPSQLRMNDAERLNEIDHIYDDITGTLSRLRTFNGQTSIQDLQRAKEAGDLGTLQSLHGLKTP
jgi:hypothetical protein